MPSWKIISNSLKTWQSGLVAVLAFFSLITGALGQFMGILSFIPDPYKALTKVCLLYIGAITLIWLATWPILTMRSKASGFTTNNKDPFIYSLGKRRGAWIIRILALIPIWLLISWGLDINKKIIAECSHKSRFTGLLLAKFSPKDPDAFSSKLYDYLASNLKDTLVQIDNINQLISLDAKIHYADSLHPLLRCYKNGMVVFGSRSLDEKSFHCNFYINGIQSTGQKVTNLLEPIGFDVPIDTQMKTVGMMVLAHLYYKQGKNQQSMEQITSMLEDEGWRQDTSLASACFMLKGLNEFQTNQYTESIKSFELANNFDNKNTQVQNAMAYLRTLKFYEASFVDTGKVTPDLAHAKPKLNFLIKKGLPINDSVSYTFTDLTGTMIKDTIFPLTAQKLVILPFKSAYYPFYLGKDKAIRLGTGSNDSLRVAREWMQASFTPAELKRFIGRDNVAKEWEKVVKDPGMN